MNIHANCYRMMTGKMEQVKTERPHTEYLMGFRDAVAAYESGMYKKASKKHGPATFHPYTEKKTGDIVMLADFGQFFQTQNGFRLKNDWVKENLERIIE